MEIDNQNPIDQQATEQNDQQATEQNDQQVSYDDLLSEYKQSIEQMQKMSDEISKMRELLNNQFSVTNQAPTMESEIDSYLDSENSITGRLLASYGKDGKK